MPNSPKPRPVKRRADQYSYFTDIQTRWSDNDVYGHVNNALYYHYFDTVVNNWLIAQDFLVVSKSDVIGLVVNTSCDYFAPISYPQTIKAGLKAGRIGTSSVTYQIGLFVDGDDMPCAQGTFTHVYVNEATRKPATISDKIRGALNGLGL